MHSTAITIPATSPLLSLSAVVALDGAALPLPDEAEIGVGVVAVGAAVGTDFVGAAVGAPVVVPTTPGACLSFAGHLP